MEAPMSSSLGAMGPLLRKLDLLLAPEYPLRRSLKQAIELLKEDLEEVNDDLVEQSMLESPSNKAKYWMNEVRELSYDIEDCIDDMMRPHTGASAKVRSVHGHRVARLKINRFPKLRKASTRMARIAEVRALLRETSERHERYQLDDCSSKSRFAFTGTHSRVSALCKTSVDLIGVDDSRKKLTDWLTNQEENQLKVLAIVGSSGIGKTTLVRALYRELKGQFECRAFIRVSRKPDMSKLIGEIISQVQGPKQTSDYSALQNSIDSIRVLLQDKRYFIVIDDLWDSTAWDILNNAFPKSQNCSRIIITAEVQDVVAECSGYHSVNLFEMKPLGNHDSEKLFLRRGFGFTHCPDKLKEVSCMIVKECGGLPLAIITMAGLLASELDNTDIWTQLLQCFFPSLAILTLEEMLEKIVNHCYNGLPQYLKTCLLYLNIYPEGSTIWKVDLLKQWIAEGFVSPTEGKEGVAESYFDELVNRGMIHPEKISHNDEVLSCTVHHSVRDLIRHKSSEEKFITEIDYSQTIPGFHMKAHRLSLHFSSAMYASKPEGIRLSQVRSLAFFGVHRCMPSIIEFKHLRVLNLELWGDYDDCTTLNLSGLCRLFQLRYLKVVSHIFVELPSQIQGLQFLETLEIDAKVLATPIDLAHLPSLLHLSLRDGTKLHYGTGRITSLQTLQYFDIGSNSEDNVRSLGELINLQDLRLTCSQASSDEHLKRNLVALSSSLGRLANLRSLILDPAIVDLTMFVDHSYVMSSIPIFLQRLELSSPICTFSIFPEWIAKLQKLRTLKIIVRVLLQDDIDILAGLPVLTSVSLFVCRPASYCMVFHSGAFPVLKNFKYRCGALCLIFEDKALPNLQRLKLGFNVHRRGQYADVISGIEYLFNLKEINIEIGAAAGAKESDRRAAEFALKKAIKKHPRFHYFLNIKRVHWIEEDKIPAYKLEDGYNWYKYRRIRVKDSWRLWRVYKCTFPGCPTKRNVECSLADGRITEVVYSGSHNHPKPLSTGHKSSAGGITAEDHQTVSAAAAGCGLEDSGATSEESSITFADNSGSQRRDADEPDAKRWEEEADNVDMWRKFGEKEKSVAAKVDRLRVERTKAVVVETTRETTGAVVQDAAESTCRSVEHYFSHRGFKRTITSWLKGRILGIGSFGLVYQAMSDDGFFFAVKEVSLVDQGLNAKQRILQLEHEISLLSRLEHENIVQYFGTDKEDGKLYIFLELVTQGSLAALYQRYHIRDFQVSVYTRQILNGLHYLHQRNVLHRDIKCANILIDAHGVVKLADFGLAKEMSILSQAKSSKGTVYWMAPEVAKAEPHGPPADIWSLGCTVLEMLTGNIPYPDMEWTHALLKIGRGIPPEIPSKLSEDARDFIKSCVQKNPNDRPSAAQLLEHPFVQRSLRLRRKGV